jgi:hypothetical protein
MSGKKRFRGGELEKKTDGFITPTFFSYPATCNTKRSIKVFLTILHTVHIGNYFKQSRVFEGINGYREPALLMGSQNPTLLYFLINNTK